MTAWPSWATFTRQSTRCSEPAAISTVWAVSPSGSQDAAIELQHDLDGLLRLELVVDVGRQHDLVLLDEEPGSLEPDEQVLGGHDFRLGLAHLGARAHRPGLDLPGRQALGQGELDLGGAVGGGGEGGGPEGGVGEVGADDGLDRRIVRRDRRNRVRGPYFSPSLGGRTCPTPAAPPLPHRPSVPRPWPWAPCAPALIPPAIPTISASRLCRRHAAVSSAIINPPKAPRSCMRDLVRLQQVVEPAVEARLGLGMMRPLPLPEELLDVRDVRASRDVFDGLVIDGQHRRAHERLAVGAGELELDTLAFWPGLYVFCEGSTATSTTRDSGGMAISRASSWTLPSAIVRASTKMLGMSRGDDADLLDRALAPQVDDLGRQVHAVRRPDEEQDRGVDLVGVDQEPERLAGPVLLPLGDDLQVVESEARTVESLPGDREQVAALDHVALAVVDRRRQPVLARRPTP